jgi:hypothetical protein
MPSWHRPLVLFYGPVPLSSSVRPVVLPVAPRDSGGSFCAEPTRLANAQRYLRVHPSIDSQHLLLFREKSE